MSETTQRVIVIGGAPAGLTAALYLARAKLSPLVIAGEAAGGQLMWTTEVENYPGFPEGVLGPVLIEKMRTQAEKFGARIINENVTRVDFTGKEKRVWVGDKEYATATVVVTAGARPQTLNIGEEKLIGRGVSTCAVCDAAFFKDKVTFVVGGGDAAMEDTLALLKFAKSVTLIHRRDKLKASKIMQSRGLEEKKVPGLWETEIIAVRSKMLEGQEKLSGIVVKNVQTGQVEELAAEGLFLAIGHLPASDFLAGQLEVDSHGYVVTQGLKSGVDQRHEWLEGYPTQTSMTGVFAAGDVVDFRYRQAVTAAGMGAQAALDVEKYLTGSSSSW